RASLFLAALVHHRERHSFPTRRSSDLDAGAPHAAPLWLQVLVVPRQISLQPVTPVARLVDAVVLARVDHQLGFHAEASERLIHLLRERSGTRSEEHTSELQSRFDLVCRLLLEKKKKKKKKYKKKKKKKKKTKKKNIKNKKYQTENNCNIKKLYIYNTTNISTMKYNTNMYSQ